MTPAEQLAGLPGALRHIADAAEGALTTYAVGRAAAAEAELRAARAEHAAEKQHLTDVTAELRRQLVALERAVAARDDRWARLLFGKPYTEMDAQQRTALTWFNPPTVLTNQDGALHTAGAGWTARPEGDGVYTLWDGDLPVCRIDARRALALAAIAIRIGNTWIPL